MSIENTFLHRFN